MRNHSHGSTLSSSKRRAGGGEQVAVAGGVDDDVGEDGDATRLALHGDAARRAPPSTQRLAAPGVQQQAHAARLDHLVQREAQLLRIVGDRVAHAVRARSPHQPPAAVALDQRVRPAIPTPSAAG